MRLAIDIGGTFTDIVLEDKTNLFTKKVLTSSSQPEVAVIQGVVELLHKNNIKFCIMNGLYLYHWYRYDNQYKHSKKRLNQLQRNYNNNKESLSLNDIFLYDK